MSAPIIQVQYENLEDIVRRFENQAQINLEVHQNIRHHVDALKNNGWTGEAATTFFAEMEDDIFPALQRLTTAFEESGVVTRQIVETFQTAEEEAVNRFIIGNVANLGAINGIFDLVGDFIINIADHANWIPVGFGVLGLAGLKFAFKNGNILIRSSGLFKGYGGYQQAKHLVDLSATRINPGNIPGHLAKNVLKSGVTKIDIFAAVLQTGAQWIQDYQEYSGDLGNLISAIAVDTILVGGLSLGASYVGGAGGVYLGAIIGGVIGGVIGTPVGAAVGAVIGGIAGKFIASWLTDKYVIDPLLESDFREDLIEQGGETIDSAWDRGVELYEEGSTILQNAYEEAVNNILGTPLPELSIA